MKKIYLNPKRRFFKILFTLLAMFITLVNSCKKEEKQVQSDLAKANKISEAKAWYQKTYPTLETKSVVGTKSADGNSSDDLSQILKPDWSNPAVYTRLNKNVIEMPLDSAAKLALVDKNVNIQSFDYNRSYSKSSFLILNDGSNYSAYIMTIVADSSYIKNDFSKLSNNTYRKYDKDFSGYLLYYTPKGTFVNGWHYLNGKINKVLSPATTSSSGGVRPESTSSSQLKKLDSGCTFVSWTVVTIGYVNGNVATYFIDIYYFNVCDEMSHAPDPGGGGYAPPGGGGNGSPAITIRDTIKIGHVCDNLTPDQVHTIVTTVNNFITDDCATKFLSDNLKNINFTFCIGGGNSAGYVTNTKEIDFTNEYSASRIDILEHEMFHAFQDQTYNGSLINYPKGSPGYTDIEFEQAVFYDMVYGTSTAVDEGTDPDLKRRYLS